MVAQTTVRVAALEVITGRGIDLNDSILSS